MAEKHAEIAEEGDVFFFYRPRIGAEEVHGREDVQRLYMVLASREPHAGYRLFVIGRKELPETAGADGERRNWALNVLTTRKAADVRRALAGKEYETEKHGERRTGAARPVGEGKYALYRHDDHTEFAYALSLPLEPGPAQDELGIQQRAGYVLAVKNPRVSIPGFPAPRHPPKYGAALAAKFGDRRWIDADDPALLDEENAQILLIGARDGESQGELGLHLDADAEARSTAKVCKDLGLRCEREAMEPLFTGDFPATEETPAVKEVEHLPPGRRGGRAPAREAVSAAAVARMLGGIQFPKSRRGLVHHAKRHRDDVSNAGAILHVIEQLPERQYTNMADVEREVGRVL